MTNIFSELNIISINITNTFFIKMFYATIVIYKMYVFRIILIAKIFSDYIFFFIYFINKKLFLTLLPLQFLNLVLFLNIKYSISSVELRARNFEK
jgi:hypothetical protein